MAASLVSCDEGVPLPSSYSVRFLCGGREVSACSAGYGEQLQEPDVPALPSDEKYFVGWFMGNTKWDFSWGVVHDMELVARFDLVALRFECDSSFKVTPKFLGGSNLKYSLDDGATWNECESGTTISVPSFVYFRGSGNSCLMSISENLAWTLVPDNGKDMIRCSGNIETLLDCQEVLAGRHPQMDMACYFGMFAENPFLASMPDLPSTELSPLCYGMMFMNCTGLRSVTSLPAVDAYAMSCYMGMFQGCKRLHFSPWDTGEKPFISTREGIALAAPFMIDGLELQENTDYYCFSI